MRALRDAISPRILEGFTEAGLQVASSTFEVAGLPKVEIAVGGEAEPAQDSAGPTQHA